MNIDWWSLSREARIEALHLVASFLDALWNGLVDMLTSGDFTQIVLALIIIVGAISTSGLVLFRLLLRLTRHGAFGV